MNLVKLTVSDGAKIRDILLNLEHVVSLKLVPQHNNNLSLVIKTVGEDKYYISEESYALRVFEELSKSAVDLSWEAMIGE